MYAINITVLLALAAAFLAACAQGKVISVASPETTPSPTCTFPRFHKPGFARDCTFAEHVETATEYTDCGGCALETIRLGAGIPCERITTTPGTHTTTVTSCGTPSAATSTPALTEPLFTVQTDPPMPSRHGKSHTYPDPCETVQVLDGVETVTATRCMMEKRVKPTTVCDSGHAGMECSQDPSMDSGAGSGDASGRTGFETRTVPSTTI